MNPVPPNPGWRLTLAICALLLAGLAVYSGFAIARALREPAPARALAPEPPGPALAPDAMDDHDHAAAPPPVAPAMDVQAPAPPAKTPPDAAAAARGIAADFEATRQREAGRKELIENLRKQASENPDDPGALSKERIDQLEKSGDSLM